MAPYSRTFRHIGAAKRAAARARHHTQKETRMRRTYQMSPFQSREWSQGREPAMALEDEIAQELQDAGITDDVDVLLADGSVAYTLWQPGR